MSNEESITYACPMCGAVLVSPVSEAHKEDECPRCHERHVVPGDSISQEELTRIRREQERILQQKREQSRKEQEKRQEQESGVTFAVLLCVLVGLGTFLAGPGWYLWSAGHKVVGGILLGITSLLGVAAIGVGKESGIGAGKEFVAFLLAAVCAGLVYFFLIAVFGAA